ncbi:MAG: phage tail terminator-like protein [Pseudomonadota bacterium]
MSYADARDAICGRFDARWAGRTPVAWPNHGFAVPSGAPWVRLTIVDGEARQASLGSPGANLHRHTGVIMVQVFVPIDSGTRTARELADEAAEIFRHQRFDAIRCDVPSVREIGPDDVWFQVNMSCPFRRDELL